ncbi:DUF3037 domain-containing protein [Confluentibacter flavum]|uniref:DUF3037 domain-containing protein n=1 Tax=Confluentibacter flavum TaxID=1909700 RepID=A0A2N3HFF8_9FLAO|nr:DUF3037 domain-containing protein [Confluentibacter flavum]PKQ43624.1 DUF3037 domain-containing protein [Confluentibacter flavum]
MPDKFTFKYAIIRMVPKVEREEFFNVGVILFCKRKKFLDLKYHISEAKLKAFSSEIELEVLNEYLNAWKLICKGDASGGKIGQLELSERFGWLTSCRSTIIQSSKTYSGLDSDPQKALNDIFNRHVL